MYACIDTHTRERERWQGLEAVGFGGGWEGQGIRAGREMGVCGAAG